MAFVELFFISIGLSMDAFAAAVCKGLSLRKFNIKMAIVVGLYFGLFQAGMPLIGYFLGVQFKDQIVSIDHWVAFALLGLIGVNMIRESRKKECKDEEYNSTDYPLSFKKMSVLAFSTSVDALAIGVSFAFLEVRIVPAILFIGIVTFVLSFFGVKIGNVFGLKYKSKAELAGGAILVLMGINILFEHTEFINFFVALFK
nr:manganese efflux pump MntP family protein [uncultured Bacillus sp.]